MRSRLLLLVAASTLVVGLGCSDDVASEQASPDGGAGWDIGNSVDADADADVADTEVADTADVSAPDVDVHTPDTSPDVAPDAAPDVAPDADAGPVDCNPNTSGDCDYDGLLDCEERQIGTAICDADTDNDRVNDIDELLLGTDPNDDDTDGDGLTDGREVDLQLDPRSRDTYGDGTINADRWFVNACDNPQAEPMTYHTSDPVTVADSTGATHTVQPDWQLALPTSIFGNYKQLTIDSLEGAANPDERLGAAVYDNPVSEIAGFVVSYTAPPGVDQPLNILQNWRSAVFGVGAINQQNAGSLVYTHDGFRAASGRYAVSTSSAQSARGLRDQLLIAGAPFDAQDVGGLDALGGPEHTHFELRLLPVLREFSNGQKQVLVLAAVVPTQRYQSDERTGVLTRAITSPSSLAEIARPHETECEVEVATSNGKIDLYWVLEADDDLRPTLRRIKQSAQVMFDKFAHQRLDVRMGVTTMDPTNGGRLDATVGWHSDLATFQAEVQKVIDATAPDGHGYGLQSAHDGIEYMTTRDGTTPANQQLRSDADLVTLFVTDKKAQSLVDTPPTSPAGAQLLNTYANFFMRHGPIVQMYESGSACSPGFMTNYDQVMQRAGGQTISNCGDLDASFAQLLVGLTDHWGTEFPLRHSPIALSVSAIVEGRWVPWDDVVLAGWRSMTLLGRHTPRIINGVPERAVVAYQRYSDLCSGCTH